MKYVAISIVLLSILLTLSGCQQSWEARASEQHGEQHEEHHEGNHKVVATSAVAQDVISTEQYVCQIHSRRHIEVRALEGGYLQDIRIHEGQAVKQGDLLFKILPVLFQAKLNADVAEARLAEIEYENTMNLFKQNVVAKAELALAKAKLEKAEAKVKLAKAELAFTDVKAPFDGIVDRQINQQGSLIEEGDILTTLSDNNVMWAYFNVPEARYLEYQADLNQTGRGHDDEDIRIELVLANGETFPQAGKIGAIEADFDNTTGNIPFRADFPNPDGLLRNGQTGKVLIHRKLHNAIVIPQRATYEILAKQYVYVIGDDDVVHQREIVVEKELEDIYVIGKGLDENDKIIFEGIRQVRDGDEVEYEFREPAAILANLKNHAE